MFEGELVNSAFIVIILSKCTFEINLLNTWLGYSGKKNLAVCFPTCFPKIQDSLVILNIDCVKDALQFLEQIKRELGRVDMH